MPINLHEDIKRYSDSEPAKLEKRQAGTAVTGVSSSRCYNRRNIEVLRTADPDEFNMFCLAMADLQNTGTENSQLSWYGIAGIHGRPYQAWGQPSNGRQMGYCTHSRWHFSLWHRPYVILMEQTIQAHARAIAATFPAASRARWQAAADRMRLPYYDWADRHYGGRIPPVMTTPTITVTRPAGPATIANPLYQYNFRGAQSMLGGYSGFRNTVRDPPAAGSTTSNIGGSNAAMTNSFTGRHANTFNLFSRAGFPQFSSQCEGIHNGVHTNIGGGGSGGPMGHMGSTDTAAFDPIFWMHHCQVDRLIAMYQVMYPGGPYPAEPAYATYGRIVPGTLGPNDDLTSPLYPFRGSNGAYLTGSQFTDGRGIWNWRYGYPEISCNSNVSGNTVNAAVRDLYGPGGGTSKREAEPAALALPEPRPRPRPKKDGEYTPDDSEVGFERKEYVARFFIDQSEVPGMWVCHVFLGDAPTNIGDYLTSPNRCGVFSSFSSPGHRHDSMPYSYELSLTDLLQERGILLNDKAVTNYCTTKFTYIMVAEDGSVVDLTKLKTFKVGICTMSGKYAKHGSNKLASFGDCKVLTKITEKKPCGVKNPEQLEIPPLLSGQETNITAKYYSTY